MGGKAHLAVTEHDSFRLSRILLSATSIMVVLVAWSILSYGRLVQPYFLPTPSAVLRETVVLFTQDGYMADVWASLLRVGIAFVLCALIGVPIGIIAGRSPSVEAVLNPYLVFMRYVPISAFIPLLILWTGIGDFQKVVFLWMGTFFFLVTLVADATRSVQSEFLDTAYTLGASRQQILLHVVFPAALPAILDDLRVMMSVGWTYLVLAEIVAAESGIGYMIMEAQRFLNTPRVVVGILTVGLIGLGMDCVFRAVTWLALPWRRYAH